MHASSGPIGASGKRAAPALLAPFLLLAACGTGGSDNPALPPPSTPGSTVAAEGGPSVSVSGDVPQLAGQAAADSTLHRVAAGLPGGCTVQVERDDRQLVSFLWSCPDARVVAATVRLSDGRQLQLQDLLTGGWQDYISSVATAQLQASGQPHPVTTDLSTWYLTDRALVVAFPSGSVSFPVASLSPYLRDPSPLSAPSSS